MAERLHGYTPGGNCIGAVVLFRLARALNAMSLGESEAYHLGVSTESLKRWAVFGVALTVGAAVSAAGRHRFRGTRRTTPTSSDGRC